MNLVILANPVFKKHNITIDPKSILIQLLDLTVQLNHILPEKDKKRYTKKLPKVLLILTKKVQEAPQSQVLSERSLVNFSDHYQSSTGLVVPSDRLEDKCNIVLASSFSKNDDNGKVFVSVINHTYNQITLNNQTDRPNFEILKETQADNLIISDPQLI